MRRTVCSSAKRLVAVASKVFQDQHYNALQGRILRIQPPMIAARLSLGSLVTKGYEDLVSRVLVADGEL